MNISKQLKSAMANSRPAALEALKCGPPIVSEISLCWKKID
jgi:hypothetical protein